MANSSDKSAPSRSLAAPPSTVTGGLRRYAALIGLGLFVTTLAQTQVMGRLPVQFLLKDHLGLPPQAMALFFAMIAIPWDLKPLAGLLSDSVPLLGTRRRHYLLLSATAAAGAWWLMGVAHHTFAILVLIALALNTAMMMASTVVGGLLVEEGQKYGATGRLSSLRLIVMNAAAIIAGPLGGFLAARAFGLTATLAGLLCFALVPATFGLLREQKVAAQARPGVAREIWGQLRVVFRSGTLWSAAGMLFLVQISPGFGTPLFYYQTNALKFSPQFIGDLAVISGVLGLAGAFLYGYVCQRLNLRTLLALGILCSVGATCLYLAYRSRTAALFIEGGAGLVATLAQLPLFDLAARATPRGSEALGYSLMMSVWNIGASLSDLLGSWLFGHYHLNFMSLVWLNAGTTALVLLAIPFLPRSLVGQREGEAVVSGQ